MLDADECFHLALQASDNPDRKACMTLLHETLRLRPQHAPALYLLAVQHAELGMAARAIAGLQAALALEPGLQSTARDAARFQLGLMLLFESNQPAAAKEQLTLVSTGASGSLRAFADVLLMLADGNKAAAVQLLTIALADADDHPALAALMRHLVVQPAGIQSGASTILRPKATATASVRE